MSDKDYADQWPEIDQRPSNPEPLPLLPDTASSAPYPVDLLPDLLRDAAKAIAEHVQAPMALAAQCVVGASACLAQTRVNAPHLHSPDGMPASLFLLTLGESGDRKSECRRLAFRKIDDAESEVRAKHKAEVDAIKVSTVGLSGKALAEYLDENPLPPDPRTQYTDTTFERLAGDFVRGMSAAAWDTDEGGQMLGGASLKADTRVATLGGLVKLFDAGHVERTRSHGNLEGSGFAYHRRLTVHLMAQPVTVAEALADPLLRGQGFLPRFLFASPESLAGTRLLTSEKLASKSYDDARLQRYWDRCKAVMASAQYVDGLSGEIKPPVLTLDADADREWLAFYNEIESEQGVLGSYAGLRPFAGRAGELARRLAAVLAHFEGLDWIDGECMRRACGLVRYSLVEWLRYTDKEGIDPRLQQAQQLLDWLRKKGWVEFHRDKLGKAGPTVVRSAKRRDELLAVLVEYRWLRTADGKSFRLVGCAESAESAEAQQRHGLGTEEEVRRRAENRRRSSAARELPAENPHLSALSPHPQAPVNPGPSAESALSALTLNARARPVAMPWPEGQGQFAFEEEV
ncbi:hypothetical protein PS938_04612 [Pseudomonas fluorescens]|uniref:DUF3987 domain-containing protein n=1 Tax=Pseudomonas fluorescens TaxID=294 RepID=A0A5E7V433_PSEFL|nr:DUF3987 domain-containing protein [Pseudomonas fluorescens]VVQ18732.1 hypothetical protein PS938_04612 [Pseudomonas fluorescens]